MQLDRDTVRFNVLRNALYHTARRRGLERTNRIFNFLVVCLGTAAVGDLAMGLGVDPHRIGAAIAVIGALQLVFDFGRQARDHQVLQRDYFSLLSRIDRVLDPTEETVAGWYGDMIAITAEEPPTLRALDARAYNDAINATGLFPQTERLVIPLWHVPLAHVVAFDGHSYEKLAERQLRKGRGPTRRAETPADRDATTS